MSENRFNQTEIPQWVRDYNAAGHTSSAGKAIKISLTKVQELESQLSALTEERDRLKNDLLDALDLKEVKGPTALSMVVAERDKLKEENRILQNHFHHNTSKILRQEAEIKSLKEGFAEFIKDSRFKLGLTDTTEEMIKQYTRKD